MAMYVKVLRDKLRRQGQTNIQLLGEEIKPEDIDELKTEEEKEKEA